MDRAERLDGCWDPRCSIPEHTHTEFTLSETERLILRNTLLASRDFGLTAAEATAVAWVVKPAVERILAAHAETLEKVRALADEWEAECPGSPHRLCKGGRLRALLDAPRSSGSPAGRAGEEGAGRG